MHSRVDATAGMAKLNRSNTQPMTGIEQNNQQMTSSNASASHVVVGSSSSSFTVGASGSPFGSFADAAIGPNPLKGLSRTAPQPKLQYNFLAGMNASSGLGASSRGSFPERSNTSESSSTGKNGKGYPPQDSYRRQHKSAYKGKKTGASGINDRAAQSKYAAHNSGLLIKEKQKQEVRDMLPNFHSEARGKDVPGGNLFDMNNKHMAIIVGRADGIVGQLPTFHIDDRYKFRYATNSQTPGLHITEKLDASSLGREFVIFTNHLDRKKDTSVGLWRSSLASKDITVDKVIAALSDLRLTNITKADAQKLIDLVAKAKAQEHGEPSGLEFISVKLHNGNVLEGRALPENTDLAKYLNQHSPWMAIIRLSSRCEPTVDDFWANLMKNAFLSPSIFPHYADLIPEGGSNKYPWMKTVKENDDDIPPAPVKPQLWMRNPDSPADAPTYASHKEVNRFYLARHYRDVHSAGLVREANVGDRIIQQTTGHQHPHIARVLQAQDGHPQVLLAVKITRGDGNTAIPPITPDTKISIRDCEGDVNMDDPTASWSYTGRIVSRDEVETKFGDFVFVFEIEDKHRSKFIQGSDVPFVLSIKPNHISVSRQLAAVDRFCRRVSGQQLDLQNAIFGNRHPIVAPQQSWIQGNINPDRKIALGEYLSTTGLNPLQRKVVDVVFDSPDIITAFQGPPGTGKSATAAVICTSAAAIGKNVVACAPTRTATLALMDKLRDERRVLERANSDNVKLHDLIYFAGFHETRAALLNQQVPNDSAWDDHLWGQIVKLVKRDAALLSPCDEKDRDYAAYWLHVHATLQRGNNQEFDADTISQFLKVEDWAKRVFRGRSRNFTVVCTSNSATLLRVLLGGNWRPNLVLIDEAAFGLESDSIIPISMWPDKLVLAGDHWQLKPVVIAVDQIEYSDQLGLSLFKRYLNNVGERNIIQLTENYRMHPRIAKLPSMLVYNWLGCNSVTLEETGAYLAVHEWWTEGVGTNWQSSRRQSTLHPRVKNDMRRLLWNTRGSRSAPAVGLKSLRNFGNVNAIINVFASLLEHNGQYRLEPEDLTILTPYRDQIEEIREAFNYRVNGFTSYLDTVDSIQGGENQIIAFDAVPANEHHPSVLGFLRQWPRMNVALTRANSVLWIFGNLDAWRTEIEVLIQDKSAKNWAYLIMDLIEEGDIIDMYDHVDIPGNGKGTPPHKMANFLPSNAEEAGQTYHNWTRETEHMTLIDSQFSDKTKNRVAENCTLATRAACEQKLREELALKRQVWQMEEEKYVLYIKTLEEDLARKAAEADTASSLLISMSVEKGEDNELFNGEPSRVTPSVL